MKYSRLLGFAVLLFFHSAQALTYDAQLNFPSVDVSKLHDQDLFNEKLGQAPRFAVERAVSLSPNAASDWERLEDGTLVWRVSVNAVNAVSLNFAFDQFFLSPNARLSIYSRDLTSSIRDFTAQDNNSYYELWTPVLMGDQAIIELKVPESEVTQVSIRLFQVNQGYRTFSQPVQDAAGSCNVDVACSEGDDWRNEINSVGVISTGGSTFCTGFMVNNTNEDKTPYFMTANHCKIRSWNSASLVVYWNYQASSCGGDRDGELLQFNTGSDHVATSVKSDFTLLKLLKSPNPEWGVTYAGFDARDEVSPSATAIHHPSTDEKSISFEFDPVSITSYMESATPGDSTHIRVANWDVGTTEPGSSGSPLFNAEKRVIGQLHGGYASCWSKTADWYGRIHTSWEGDGAPTSRLKDWLDPQNTGVLYTDTL